MDDGATCGQQGRAPVLIGKGRSGVFCATCTCRGAAGWAEAGHDVVVYFDNDAKVRAPVDAMALMTRLGLTPLAVPGGAAPG